MDACPIRDCALACGVCLDLPKGEVHQCHEGHTYCAECWHGLDQQNRTCPECRQRLPLANRCRTAERAIAALEWRCEHCAEVSTRGEARPHLLVCLQQPTVCDESGGGCAWAGERGELAAHAQTCPHVVCARMMAQTLVRVREARVEIKSLREVNLSLLERVSALNSREAALQGRVGTLEAVVSEGGRRQRRRLGRAPPGHDAAPSFDEVVRMDLVALVATLLAHFEVPRLAQQARLTPTLTPDPWPTTPDPRPLTHDLWPTTPDPRHLTHDL